MSDLDFLVGRRASDLAPADDALALPGFGVTPQADAAGLANFRRMMDDEKVYR